MAILPWAILAKNTTFQPDLGATPAELTFGSNPLLPGDLALSSDQPADVPKLLAKLKENAARKPVQTSHHGQPKPYFPPAAETCTHVYVEQAKPGVLGTHSKGPFEIIERVGKSCLKLKVGEYVGSGLPRMELHHWSRCQPADMDENQESALRPKLGRKAKEKASRNSASTSG